MGSGSNALSSTSHPTEPSTSCTARSGTNCIPRVPVLPIPDAASALSHGSREIAIEVGPNSHATEAFSAK